MRHSTPPGPAGSRRSHRRRGRRRRPPCHGPGPALDRWVGDGDSLGDAGDRRAPRGGRPGRPGRRGQGRVRTPSSPCGRPSSAAPRGSSCSAAWAAPGSTMRWPTSGCWRIPALRDIPVDLLDPTARVSLITRARPRAGRRSAASLPGPGRRPRLAPAAGRRGRRRDDRAAWPTRWPTSRCPPGRPAACPTSGPPRTPGSRSGRGRLLVVEGPATLSA